MILSLILFSLFLVILSIWDLKTFNKKRGYIPSALTSGILVCAFLIQGEYAVYSGVLTALIGLVLIDFKEFSGLADYKVLVATGMMLPHVIVLPFCIFLLFNSAIVKLIVKYKTRLKEIPYIPVIWLSFLMAMILSMWIGARL